MNSGAHRGQFNDTVFEVLGAENSKTHVVELWGGGGHGDGRSPGRTATTPFLRFWGLKTPKTMSLNGGGEVTGEGGSPGTRGEFNDTVFEVLGADNSKNDVVELPGGVGGGGFMADRGRGGRIRNVIRPSILLSFLIPVAAYMKYSGSQRRTPVSYQTDCP